MREDEGMKIGEQGTTHEDPGVGQKKRLRHIIEAEQEFDANVLTMIALVYAVAVARLEWECTQLTVACRSLTMLVGGGYAVKTSWREDECAHKRFQGKAGNITEVLGHPGTKY